MKSIPLEILKMRDGYHILCRIKISNKEYRILIDTGSTDSLLDLKKFKNINIENSENITYDFNGNSIKNKYLKIDEILIGDISIKNKKFSLIDFSNFNKNFISNGLPRVDGIIGGDILMEYNAIIDYKKREIIFNI